MSDDRSRRLSQIFDPLARFTDHSGAGHSASTPNSPRLMPRRSREPPPPPPRPVAQGSRLNPLLPLDQLDVSPAADDGSWQERCLELQLELHRSRHQATRVRDMLRDKLSELEQRVLEAEGRAEEAEDKVRAMEQRLCDWPGSTDGAPKAITRLEGQIEEQKQLRLQDAKQVEAKAARIKEWVTNKLRELEQQNQLLREQNDRCNQQLELLRNHIAAQGTRNSAFIPSRASLSLEVRSESPRATTSLLAACRRRSESLEGPKLPTVEPHYSTPARHRRNLSIGTTNLTNLPPAPSAVNLNTMNRTMDERTTASLLADDLAAAVENLVVAPTTPATSTDGDTTHDYAEIYTPSRERTPAWAESGRETDAADPPTPPLHRFPSWEAKIYQVADDGLQQSLEERLSPACRELTASTSYQDVSVPVYATVKGRASQIRSEPFTGDSSDDSSDGEESLGVTVHNTPHHHLHCVGAVSGRSGSSESSLSATSPSKSLKTSSTTSPAKHSSSGSPKHTDTRDTSFESGMSDDYAVPPDACDSCPSLVSHTSHLSHVSHASHASHSPHSHLKYNNCESPRKQEALEKSGHLAKLGGKLKTWRKRWFVLKNGTLHYWKSSLDVSRPAPGTVPLVGSRVCRGDQPTTFQIHAPDRTYYLTADTPATMEDWIRVLQNVQRRNATKLLLSTEEQKPTVQGWLTKVKHGHSKRCWCVLIHKMFLYFKSPGDQNPMGEINMRLARVEQVEHVSDSEGEERTDDSPPQYTIAIYPPSQQHASSPTYLLFDSKAVLDAWLYALVVVSGGGLQNGTPTEQLLQKLIDTDGDPNCVLWKHPQLVYTKENITSPLTTLSSEALQAEALKLFKCIQLFMSVMVEPAGIEYHVVLAQDALGVCTRGGGGGELADEALAALCRQTAPPHPPHGRPAVQVRKLNAKLANQLLLCATQSLFSCDSGASDSSQPDQPSSPNSHQAPLLSMDCKSNPPTYSFVQGWQLLALAVSLFVPRNNRLLWYLKMHLRRHSDTKTECGKYAAYCSRALERCLARGPRSDKPSRMEVLSILLRNPYHHNLPHAIPVHMLNNTYQVVSFDGSTTVEEFLCTLSGELGCREPLHSGFSLYSDDPIEKDLEHHIHHHKKLCDIISRWETALREKGSGKFENTRVIRLTFRNRLYFKSSVRTETEKERLLLCYQINQQVVAGRFPVTRQLALELGALMAHLDLGDYCATNPHHAQPLAERFYPYRYRAPVTNENNRDIEALLRSKWCGLQGRSSAECVRTYLNCTRKWPYFGHTLFQAQIKQPSLGLSWLCVGAEGVSVLELASMAPLASHPLEHITLFGGLQDDLMMLIDGEDSTNPVTKMIISLNKIKMAELTHLIADYKNALSRPSPAVAPPPAPHSAPPTVSRPRPLPHTLPHAHTPTHTINSHATTITLASDRNATLTLSSHASTLNTEHRQLSQGQPDILKSTPDHHPKKRNHVQDTGVA